MARNCRSWWRNCALNIDAEILAIDRMEDGISPVDPNTAAIRELISSFELCHHKAERWIINIIEAIGTGETKKGLGTRAPDQLHPVEQVWQNASAALAAWCAGSPASSVDLIIDTMPASQILINLGTRSPIKEWQVQRVIDKIRSIINWPQPIDDPAAQYQWILLNPGDYDVTYYSECPEYFKEHEDFWLATVRTIVHDTENGEAAELSLALAIDMLWPCHWNFVQNLQLVLTAIGGKLHPEKPFAACGRNIAMFPKQHRMEILCHTLQAFCGDPESSRNEETDRELLQLLGRPTAVKKWLAASLDKTIRLQLNPPVDLRAISALTGPDWIRQ